MPGLNRLVIGELVSMTGTLMSTLALPWFVLTTTHSATKAGIAGAAEVAPVLIFGVISGGWAERVGVRRFMVASDLLRAPLLAAVPLLHWAHLLPLWLLLLLIFVGGCFNAPYAACQQIMLATVTGENEAALSRASSTLQTASRVTLLVGPPLAGALIALFGAPTILLLDAMTFLLVAPLVLGLPEPAPEQGEPGEQGAFAGLAIVYRSRLLGNWTTSSFFSEAAYQGAFLALPVLALHRYDTSATLVGVILAAFGGGAVLGSVLAHRLATRVPARSLAVGGKTAQSLVFLALVPVGPAAAVIGVYALLGIANGITNGPANAVRLALLTPAQRARALTAITTITWVGSVAGLVVAGPALDHLSAEAVFAVLAVVQLASAALFGWGATDSAAAPNAATTSTAPTAPPAADCQETDAQPARIVSS